MKVVRTIGELRNWVSIERKQGLQVGLVPTMGSVHEGHLSLVDVARDHVDSVVATIFVNPLQFSPKEDFNRYPRDEQADRKLFEMAGVKLLFAPNYEEIFLRNHSTTVHVGKLGEILEGESRPHFFVGVATIVTKLLIQVFPDVAIFGEKDYQQLCVVKKLVQELDLPIDIIGGKTIRENDGLAISSRNQYLSEQERKCAPELYAGICSLADDLRAGRDVNNSCESRKNNLINAGFSKIEYLVVRDAKNLEKVNRSGRKKRILVAAWLGSTRLIDNVAL